MPTSLHWIRPPRQQRSQETLQRVLDAAEAVIQERGIDDMTVTEVAKRAGSSIGSMYARFGDKETLVRSVFDRFYEEVVATAEHIFDPNRWQDEPLPELVQAAIKLMLGMFRERRLLIAGFTTRAARSPEIGALGERLGLLVADRAHAFLKARGEPIAHPRPEVAVRFAVLMVLSALEARALYSGPTLELMPEDEVAAELTRMCLEYLGLREGRST